MINVTVTRGPIVPAKEGPAAAPKLLEPTLADMALNFSGSIAGWAAAGLKIVDEADYTSRLATCQGCDLWAPAARFGLGRCKACGCTKLKLWLATEVCKHPAGSRWPDSWTGQPVPNFRSF